MNNKVLSVIAVLALVVALFAGYMTLQAPASPGVQGPQLASPTGLDSLALKGDLDVAGDVTIDGTLDAAAWTAPGFITSTENLAMTGTLAVTGATTLTGALAANGGLAVDTPAFTVANTSGNVGTTGTLTVGGAAALNGGLAMDSNKFTVADTSGNTSIGGTLGVTGNSSLAGFLILTPASTVAVGAGATITPLGTMQPITSTTGVTCSTSTCIANGASAGQLLILRNANASDTITVDGTGGNVECKTDKVLGAQDTLSLEWNGADWVCLSIADNS